MKLDELRECQKAIHDLVEKFDYAEALPLIYTVLESYPDDAPTLHMLGYIYLNTDKFAFAYQLFRRALQESPKNHTVWTSLGRAAHELARFTEAINCFVKAAEINPEYTLAYSNAASTLVHMSDWPGAIKACNLALETDPQDKNARMNLAHCYIAQGEWKKGWDNWGLSLGGKFRKEWTYGDEPRWYGEEGKRLVVYGEQGLGDEISYASCLPDAVAISKKVYVDCDPKLEGLFRRSFPGAEVHGTRREEHPKWFEGAEITARCAIGGLPGIFRPTDDSFPGTPYLVADPDRRTMWRALFDKWGGKVVGIATTGGGDRLLNSYGREIPMEAWLPILKRKRYHFVSLDYRPRDSDDMERIHGVKIHKFPAITNSADYDDTAALIAELDAVIGIHTAALHCSAGLGVRTHALIPKWHQWRFSRPFYPWARCFRQCHQVGEWEETLDKLVW